MSPKDQPDFSLRSHFGGEFSELLTAIAADCEARPEQDALPADVPPHAPRLDLSQHPVVGCLKEWWLASSDSPLAQFDPEHIIGSVLRNKAGKTSPIAGVDPVARRVQTRSGSVYALGVPELSFAARGRHVLRKMGF